MKEERVMDALGAIKDAYVVEAAASGKTERHRRWVAAVLVLLLGTAFFTQTAPGAAAAAFVREQVTGWIETLFPPKEMTVTVEGKREEAFHIAGGQEPGDAGCAVPGFAVYYDPDRYELLEENGRSYIRSIPVLPTREELRSSYSAQLEGLSEEAAEKALDALLAQQTASYEALPRCELEILHVPDVAPAERAEAVRQEMQQSWPTVSDMGAYEPLACVMFRADGGTAWDSPIERLYFMEDGQTGTYQLTVRYFAEAEEGHGARLTAILNTFERLPPQ